MSVEQLMAASGYAERTVRKELKALGAQGRRSGPQGEKLWSLGDEVTA